MKIEKTVTKWKAPDKNDARVLGMPQIPHPLQGDKMQPRTIVGASNWDKMRRKCYHDAGYKCEACGYISRGKGDLNCHELFSYDYIKGTGTFERLICLCIPCHLLGIHVGRALTMYRHGDPVYSAERLLNGAEHTFSTVAEWNANHKEEPVLLYSGWLAYLEQPELKPTMEKLIKQYNIKFYSPPKKGQAKWSDWKMIWGEKEYPTPYQDEGAWEEAMNKMNSHKYDFANNLQGGIFDEIDAIINEKQ